MVQPKHTLPDAQAQSSREQDQRTQICDGKEREVEIHVNFSKFDDRHAKLASSAAVTLARCTSRAYSKILIHFTLSFPLEIGADCTT